jgi:small subunit ribosomal protein S5e
MQRGGKKQNTQQKPAENTQAEETTQQINVENINEKQPIQTKFFANEVTLYGKYKYDTEVKDISLTELIAINNSRSNVYIPHTAGRYQVKRFRKTTCPIIERLTNSLMMHGRNNGKKNLASAIVKQALEIVHLTTNKNPLETVLDAISNAGPREDSTKIGKITLTVRIWRSCQEISS